MFLFGQKDHVWEVKLTIAQSINIWIKYFLYNMQLKSFLLVDRSSFIKVFDDDKISNHPERKITKYFLNVPRVISHALQSVIWAHFSDSDSFCKHQPASNFCFQVFVWATCGSPHYNHWKCPSKVSLTHHMISHGSKETNDTIGLHHPFPSNPGSRAHAMSR